MATDYRTEALEFVRDSRTGTTSVELRGAVDRAARTTYADVVYLQGDKADDVVSALFRADGVVAYGMTAESVTEAVAYLSQWDMGEYGEIRDEIPAGSRDAVVFVDGGEYVMVANLGLGYVSLSRIIKSGE